MELKDSDLDGVLGAIYGCILDKGDDPDEIPRKLGGLSPSPYSYDERARSPIESLSSTRRAFFILWFIAPLALSPPCFRCLPQVKR